MRLRIVKYVIPISFLPLSPALSHEGRGDGKETALIRNDL